MTEQKEIKKSYADEYIFDPILGNFFRLPKKNLKLKKTGGTKK